LRIDRQLLPKGHSLPVALARIRRRTYIRASSGTAMISSLRKLFGAQPAQPGPSVPEGERVYAVGDVHGRADLFAALVEAIDADDAARGPARTTVVLLGDLVDRGPDSAGVIALARAWGERRTVRLIAGNHEEMFLDSFDKREVLRHFLRYGGRETLLSYPIDPSAYTRADLAECRALARAAVPAQDLAFIGSFEDSIVLGDYLFVHAGIRPGVPLEEQRTGDLRWIRETFLNHAESFGPVVVHGHTIYDQPELRANRIGIDTGAYASGRLTALGLENGERWLIETQQTDGATSVTQRSIA
jgi:serine/threonine protein phosphatase 1